MSAMSFPRLRHWHRLARFADSLWILCRTHVGVTLDDIGEAIGPTTSSRAARSRARSSWRFNPLKKGPSPGKPSACSAGG